MRLTLLSLTIYFILLLSCKKNTSGTDASWPCDIIEDSTAISNQIIGSWKWIKYSCSTNEIMKADKDIKVVFNANATFTIQQNSAIIAQGSWNLKRIDISNWILDLTSPSDYLKGFVLFCNDQVAFVDSYEDGCNNYFEENN